MEPDHASHSNPAKSSNEKVTEALDMIPLIGKPCAWVYKHWGLTGLLSLLAGFFLALGLGYFGALPNGFVSAAYKNGPKPTTSKVRPSSIEVTSIADPKPEWLQPYADWLDEEAASRRGPELRAGVGAVISSPLHPTEQFKWELKASPGFDLNGRAFRVRADGYFKVLPPIKDQHSIYFEVPECDQDDKLVGLILATWQGSQTQVDILDTFHSTVIPEGR